MSPLTLRPGQERFVDDCLRALERRSSTLGVAPTGYGKTIMLSEIIKRLAVQGIARRFLFLQHTLTLIDQNFQKVSAYVHPLSSSLCHGQTKDYGGDIIFSTTQTAVRVLDHYPVFDILLIDEAHHATTKSNRTIIESLRARNPSLKIFGVTATPNRGDRQGLGAVFGHDEDSLSGYVSLCQAIDEGVLVAPRTLTIKTEGDAALQSLIRSKKALSQEEAMAEGAKILNVRAITSHVIEAWQEQAQGRPTIVFCSSVAHADDVAREFREKGIASQSTDGHLKKADRQQRLADFAAGKIQVLTNVFVLTEGFDHPPTSCVILLRALSTHATFVQMIGRGLRRSPETDKTDCVVLDFGCSSTIHGTLEQLVDLEDKDRKEIEEREERQRAEEAETVELRRTRLDQEIDLLKKRHDRFLWVRVHRDLLIIPLKTRRVEDVWVSEFIAVCVNQKQCTHIKAKGKEIIAHRAIHEDRLNVYKEPPLYEEGLTEAQANALMKCRVQTEGLTKQEASVHAFYHFQYKRYLRDNNQIQA